MSIFINNKLLETFKFPGGECQVRLSDFNITNETNITANLNNSDDVMSLLLAADAIRRINHNTKIILTIPYFPYARQDRVCNKGESLSVKVMADIINSLNCDTVQIYDPHSDVTPALLKNCQTFSLDQIINQSFLSKEIISKNLTLVSPDAGAEKKVKILAKQLSTEGKIVNTICASKTRDTLTGNIIDTKIHNDVRNQNLIIVDDICDGGRTFIELSKALKKNGANDIYLYVTHGIFSSGLEILQNHFKHIYCYHTMLETDKIDPSFMSILKI